LHILMKRKSHLRICVLQTNSKPYVMAINSAYRLVEKTSFRANSMEVPICHEDIG